MAERSFTNEFRKLRLGDGEVFHGEGILAVTKALLQSGESYVAGYQGAPISHLMDVLTDANQILEELGVHFEHSASEATAAATMAASVNYPLRGAVTFKSTVGTNVASDALANLASGGVTGGALIVVGEDYGEGSSIMQERSHAFAMKSQMWLLDPRPNLPSIVRAVEEGFALSEATNTPVMLELRIRACHVHGRFVAGNNVRPVFTLKDAIENPVRDVSRIADHFGERLSEALRLSRFAALAARFATLPKRAPEDGQLAGNHVPIGGRRLRAGPGSGRMPAADQRLRRYACSWQPQLRRSDGSALPSCAVSMARRKNSSSFGRRLWRMRPAGNSKKRYGK
jgi:indolepyruvate ferredoxin oxidoreductase, alpha subunit